MHLHGRAPRIGNLSFMIQFTPNPHRALGEMYRVTKSGGTLGLSMWGELCFDAPWEDTVRQCESDYVYPHAWSPGWADAGQIRTYIEEVGFKDVRSQMIRPRWDFENPEDAFRVYFESQNPESMRGYQPWWDKGMESVLQLEFERIVREKYNKGKDFDMKVFLFIERK